MSMPGATKTDETPTGPDSSPVSALLSTASGKKPTGRAKRNLPIRFATTYAMASATPSAVTKASKLNPSSS